MKDSEFEWPVFSDSEKNQKSSEEKALEEKFRLKIDNLNIEAGKITFVIG